VAGGTEPDGADVDALLRWFGQTSAATVHDRVPGSILQLLRTVPSTVSAAGTTLTIESYLWRDFEPISPPDGKQLIIIVQPHSESPDVLQSTAVERIAVVHDDAVWIAPAVEEQPRSDAPLEVIARGGPKWGPHVLVDVIVQLNTADGRSHFVASRGQRIDRTD
jgi:hypothetical protein